MSPQKKGPEDEATLHYKYTTPFQKLHVEVSCSDDPVITERKSNLHRDSKHDCACVNKISYLPHPPINEVVYR